MGAGEDLVNSADSAAEGPVNHATGTAENPVTSKGDSSENSKNNQAADVENPTNDQPNSAVSPVSNQAVGSENPANEQPKDALDPLNNQAGGAVNPVNDQALVETPINNKTCGAEDLIGDQSNDHLNVAENSVHDQAHIETPINNKTRGAEDLVGDQSNDHLNVAENHSNDQVGGAANPVHDQEGSLNDTAGGTVDTVNDKAGGAETETPANDQLNAAENLADDRAHAAKISTNDITAGDETENSMKDNTGDVQIPVNNEADAVENPLDDKQDAAKNLVEEKADAIATSSNSKEDTVETPNRADRLPAEAKEILISLAGKWEDVLDASALQVIPLKGAMTNEVFQIKWPATTGETSRKVVVRIYGEGVEIFFDRDDEIRTFEYMSKNGQGPRLLGRFTNGRVEEFIHARTLSAPDLRDPSISALIAAKLKEFHNLDMPGEKKVNLWCTLRNWLIEAKRLSSPKEVEAFYLDTVDKEISILEKELSGTHQQIGFCHNDLQYGNIMLDEETNSVTIIDYEYASHNPVAYDIANHFCEMAANYHTETPHILDYSKYPDFEERARFIKAYLSSSGEQPSESEVEHLLQEVEKYTLANHLFWGLWGIISGQVNTIEFNYKEYAKQRFQEYWARKPYLLSSDAPSPFNAPEGTGELASTAHTKGHSSKNSGIFRKMKRVLGLGLFRSKS
ncbi:Protein kinase superfamily protein [Trifolium repens]|nr:Protein kinase superfamily protein [Trifolium repens]